jgi:hypothetical protein
MKLLILASVILIGPSIFHGQTSSPTNRNKQQQSASPTKDQSTSKGLAGPTPVTVEGAVTVVNQPAAEEKERQAKQDAKSIWQKLFAPEQWPNIVLCVVGIAGVLIALKTLGKLERQTKATEIAADAAKKSADTARDALFMKAKCTNSVAH